MNMKLDYDIAIVGGGMIGSALAAGLMSDPACDGLKVALIDAGDEPEFPPLSPGSFDSRVVALSGKSKDFLQQVGAWEGIVNARCCPYLKMHVWDGEGTASIGFDCAELQRDSLGHIVENRVVLLALRDRLRTHTGFAQVDMCTGIHIEGVTLPQTDAFGNAAGMTELHFNGGDFVRAKLVLAVDGAHSNLRSLAGLSTREWDYGHSAIVTTVKTERSHQYTAWQRFTTQGPIAFLPLSHQSVAQAQYFSSASEGAAQSDNYCSIVWSVEHDKAQQLLALSTEAFCAQLGREFEHTLGAITWADKRVGIPLRQRHAKQYFVPGVALVGDAAHTIHPLAGLGANLGLADASVLVAEIARACRREISVTDTSILRRYQRQRQGENLAVMVGMEGFKRLFAADALPIRWARNTGMRGLNNAGWVKNKIVSLVAG